MFRIRKAAGIDAFHAYIAFQVLLLGAANGRTLSDLYLRFVEGTDHPGSLGRREYMPWTLLEAWRDSERQPRRPASVSRNSRTSRTKPSLGDMVSCHSRPYAAKLNDDGWSFIGTVPTSNLGTGEHRIAAYVVAANASSLRLTQDLHFYVTPGKTGNTLLSQPPAAC